MDRFYSGTGKCVNGKVFSVYVLYAEFIRLRLNILQLAAGMKGKANRAVALLSEGG